MNDEQQLWKDVQKFMTQFPGFVAIAKKIGDIGSLQEWQASEQHKLDKLVQEIGNQRQILTGERLSAEAEIARKMKEIDDNVLAHVQQLDDEKIVAKESAQNLLEDARQKASKLVADATFMVKNATKELNSIEAEKVSVAADLKVLKADVVALKAELDRATNAIFRVKEDHATFLKKLRDA